jgi:16S rRNA (guanine1516-N2)-methyltransferase
MTIIVTTTYQPTEESINYAQFITLRVKGKFVMREKLSLDKLRKLHETSDIIVVNRQELKWYRDQLPPYFFHPSMALLRVERLMKGESDSLMDYAQIKPGDMVLDCTAGLGSDALVFSYAVGQSGLVEALESEAPLAILLEEGLKNYVSEIAELNEAMRRIQVSNQNHLQRLSDCPDQSYDVVYFDPMFRKALEQSSSIHSIRAFSNPEPLLQQAVEEAVRVARKTVVIKEHKDSREFERLGFHHVFRTYSKIAYGVMEV